MGLTIVVGPESYQPEATRDECITYALHTLVADTLLVPAHAALVGGYGDLDSGAICPVGTLEHALLLLFLASATGAVVEYCRLEHDRDDHAKAKCAWFH